ncbi:phage portal protein [Actinoplanes sp. NPDC026623]|uniref:phage portal protein n=1 Tax=Actinoplanes sp. NPDC026623 TaxID=3155610 RepID=UPI003410E24D
MPIDVQTRLSPGWWMDRLFTKLNQRARQRRLRLLADIYGGDPPLPIGAENVREMYIAFQRLARSNYAQLAVAAVSERMTPVGFRTAADGGAVGDKLAAQIWKRSGMPVTAADVHDMMLNLGEAYVIVGPVDEETGAPVVTAEDPRTIIGEPHPVNPMRLRAALKVMRDDIEGEDRAYLYLPGEVWVARRTASYAASGVGGIGVTWSPRAWDWAPERSGTLGFNRLPVVRFLNKDQAGEYEAHQDLLARINHQTLQRLVIATMQAFRQRAVKGLDDIDEETGEEIDYSDLFVMDPAALWQLPAGAEMWESGTVDLRPILDGVKADVQEFGAVTRTPMFMLQPSGVNQSAEGASLQREGLIFRTQDRIDRTSLPWSQVMALSFLQAGEPARADLSKLETLWASPARLSLSERADAASKAANDIPRRIRLIDIWGYTPERADELESEWDEQELREAQIAAAAQTPDPTAPAAAPLVLPVLDGLAQPAVTDEGEGLI